MVSFAAEAWSGAAAGSSTVSAASLLAPETQRRPIQEPLAESADVPARHPGTREVRLSLADGGRKHPLRLADSLRVTLSSAPMGDVKGVLGPGCLS